MYKDVADKLVTALRSGEYKQAQQRLRTEDGFCCLGVLCDIYSQSYRQEGGWSQRVSADGVTRYEFLGTGGVLPLRVQEWAGMRSDNGTFGEGEGRSGRFLGGLAEMNDGGHTFDQIADTIECFHTEL